MSQLSRPFQIALGAIVLLAAVWFFALRGHSSSSSEQSASTPASTPAPASKAAARPGSTTPVVHGTAPGVEGLTRAINKAHEAVAQSEHSAKQLGEKAEQTSSSSSGSSAAGAASGGAVAPPASAHKSGSPALTQPKRHPATGTRRTSTAPSHHATSGAQSNPFRTPARQLLVERALKEGKIAVLLFWNPRGIDDQAVQHEVLLLEAVHHLIAPRANEPQVRRLLGASRVEFQKNIAVFEARAGEVTSFGSITRAVQIYQTPTILIVNKQGLVTTLTGLTDYYAIEQSIDEARHA